MHKPSKKEVFFVLTWPSWIWVSLLVFILDRASKYYVVHYLSFDQPVALLPCLNIILRYNTGAAFSLLSNMMGWEVYLLASISVLIIIVLFVWLVRSEARDWTLTLALSLVLGGALGNLVDRLRFSHVVDFIDFHIGGWHYATFNLADSAITVGVTLFLISRLFPSRPRPDGVGVN